MTIPHSMKHIILLISAVLIGFPASSQSMASSAAYMSMATQTLDSIYQHYSVPGTSLLRENYPFNTDYSATYLAESDDDNKPYAYLWPYSGTLSAVTALLGASDNNKEYRKILNDKVLPGLEEYFDTKRQPAAYSSYIVSQPTSDRFYDDNDWVGLDFIDLYEITGKKVFLEKAELIWEFIQSGTDNKFGGGVYWCEQKKSSKNTCSTAPAAVLALKLYEATKEQKYLDEAHDLYEWARQKLQDPKDYLYFDNISYRHGAERIDSRKFAYNSGQMLQAAVLLYKSTGDARYLDEAKQIAESAYNYFFYEYTPHGGEPFRILRRGNTWFSCIMFRGYAELYDVYDESKYIEAFGKSLSNIWEHGRSEEGLFSEDFSGQHEQRHKWLLTQAAMVEMFARMSALAKD